MTNGDEPRAVAVLGAGTWGIVLAGRLAANGHHVRAWDFYPEVIESLKSTGMTPRLPDFRVPPEIVLTPDLGLALDGAEVCVIVVPSTAVRSTCEAIAAGDVAGSVRLWVLCSKGIEQGTLLPLHEVLAAVLGEEAASRTAVLSGPSHAEEVARGLPTTVVACAESAELAGQVQRLFFSPRFRVYTHDDRLGAEIGGALKNVIAIAAGISDGMGFGDNSRAALITRGLAEIVRLGVAMGARRETFVGLAGLGDLVVTASSLHSRNHRFGELLAQGKNCQEALDGVGMVVEGYATAKSAHDLAVRHGIEMPIADVVFRVIYEDLPAREALEALLAREARSEKE